MVLSLQRRNRGTRRLAVAWGAAIAVGLAVSGCASQRREFADTDAPLLMWPAPPEQPRIIYLGAVSTEADLEQSTSWIDGLGELLFGRRSLGALISPYAVAVDLEGVMFVADSGAAVVHAFDLGTRAYRQFGSMSDDRSLQKPVGVALIDDQLYVADSSLRQICVFKKNGRFLFAFGQDRLERPSGISSWPAQGVIYVADTAAHTIQVFDQEGTFVGGIGRRGLGPGQFNFPTHLWVDRSGRLHVSDTLNYRIQIFAPDGTFLRMFGQQGDRPGNFAHPSGIGADSSGNIYVTDRQYENVQVFDAEGRILMAFGQEGTAPGEFWLPAGVAVDSRDRIYVADSFNKRIQIFGLLKEQDE
jgi:DNA-binding beta-propeller fold protein YncE